jgi:hypothetical protein
MRYQLFNHNNTFLGEFNNLKKAFAESKFYRDQTGNAAYLDDLYEHFDSIDSDGYALDSFNHYFLDQEGKCLIVPKKDRKLFQVKELA